MKRLLIIAFLCSALGGIGVSPLLAQRDSDRMLRDRLHAMGRSLHEQGEDMPWRIRYGVMGTRNTANVTMYLRRGWQYTIVGLCDSTCQGLDLALFDEAVRVVAQGRSVGTSSTLTFAPRRTGRFRLDARMGSCTTTACEFAVGTWAAETGGERDPADMQWERSMRDRFARAVRDSAYQISPDLPSGPLGDGAADTMTVSLLGGRQYRFIGTCDLNCEALGLVLLDGQDRGLASAWRRGADPDISVTPGGTGEFRLVVAMQQCRSSFCRYGVGVWSRAVEASPHDGAPTDPWADDGERWTAEVEARLQAWETELKGQGLRPLRDRFMGRLAGGARENNYVVLDSASRYVVRGVCDSSCGSLGLAVYDPDGTKIVEEVGNGVPRHLDFSAGATGLFRIEVRMSACRADRCRYGLGMWGKQ